MSKITDIQIQKKKTDRVNIYIDDKFAFGLSVALRFENKLEIGQEISVQKAKEFIEKDQIERLVNKALRFLSFRPRSEKELRDYFAYKGRLAEIKGEAEKSHYNVSIDKVITKIQKIGQIDDKAFALWWVEQRLRFKPRASSLIKRELLAKGIGKEIIEEITKETKESKEASEENLAIRAASKKISSYQKLDQEKFRNKMGQFLARKGFSWEVIKKVVDSLFIKRVK